MNGTGEKAGQRIFALACGLALGLSMVKFGNPVLLEHLVTRPSGWAEFLVQPWPLSWGYLMLAGLTLAAVALGRHSVPVPKWFLVLPLAWFGWQVLSSATTIAPHLSRPTVIHFLSCLVWFAIGLFALSRVRNSAPFWICLLLAFWWILWRGFSQHYGELESTRRFIYEQTDWQALPPEMLKRVGSDRIFSTLFYPNALAGMLLLMGPALLVAQWEVGARLRPSARLLFTGLLAYCSLAALYWSGSKAGWLIAVGMGALALLHRRMERRHKVLIACALCAAGLAGFFLRYAGYFERGATSVVARFDYWQAGLKTIAANPVLGTGPGTFQIAYREIKPPDAEMARLAHNDYLQQMSDSGILGGVAFAAFVLSALWLAYPRGRNDPMRSAIWLGLLAWALHAMVEFPLYIPALAWPWFLLLGYLCATRPGNFGGTPGSTTSTIDPAPSGK